MSCGKTEPLSCICMYVYVWLKNCLTPSVRLGNRLVQQCSEDAGLASRVIALEEKINLLHLQMASFNFSRSRGLTWWTLELHTGQSFALSHVQIRQGRSMEDSGGSALGDVHFSAQSSKKLCCNRCVLKYDKMQVGTKEFENMQPGVKMIIRRIGGAKSWEGRFSFSVSGELRVRFDPRRGHFQGSQGGQLLFPIPWPSKIQTIQQYDYQQLH